jgi:hypothetical protein
LPSKARTAFDENAKDVTRLLEIHAEIGGDDKGRRFRLEVLNKSAIVLITAIWEAYCEDIAAEALEHLIANVASGSALPKDLRKRMAQDINAEKNDLAMWDLADNGWRAKARMRIATLTADRNRKLNTPKTEQIDNLFETAIGLPSVSASWRWKKMSAAQAKTKLDDYITLRGAVAHRGAAASSIRKAQVNDYFQHVRRLVGKTGGKVNSFVKSATSKSLW